MTISHHYNVTTKKIQISFQLPLLTKQTWFNLFQLIPIPMSESIKPNHSMILKAENLWIAVNYQNQTKQINPLELQNCKIFGNIHICQEQDVNHLNMKPNCLSSLYWAQWLMVQKTCKVRFQEKRDHIILLNNNKWLVTPSQPVTTVTRCNSKITSKYISKQSIVKIPQGCQLELNNQIIQSDHTNNLNDNEVTMQEWDWTPLQMFPLYNTTAFNQIISYLHETDTVTIAYMNQVIKIINNSEQIINAQPLTTNADWVFMEYGIFLALMIVITAILFILHQLFGISRYHNRIQEQIQIFPYM